MPTKTVEALIEGGKASAGPPIGSSLGPLGVNIGQVVAEINKKTEGFKGMQVPVKIEVDMDTKGFEISIGTPPASALIKKEAGIEKGAGNPLQDKVADLKIEQVIKIAKMKEDSMLGKTTKEKVKEIIGTCNSMGILVEGLDAKEAIKAVDEGKFEKKIKEEKTELTAEELKELEEEKKKLAEDMEKRREEFIKTAKEIIASMEGKEKGEIKAKLREAKIPSAIIKELMPEAAAAEAPAEGKPEAKEEKTESKEAAPKEQLKK